MQVNRNDAWQLVTQWTESESLLKHMLAVEASMRAYARKFGEDEELWGVTGLLHDFDYERHPTLDRHPMEGAKVLRQKGYPEPLVVAILGHSDASGVPRESLLAKTLYAVDELSGFVVACALVRPGKSIHGLEVKSVKKKLKDKAFARGVNRDDVYRGAQEINVDLDEHIAFVIDALTAEAEALGIAGEAESAAAGGH